MNGGGGVREIWRVQISGASGPLTLTQSGIGAVGRRRDVSCAVTWPGSQLTSLAALKVIGGA